MKSFVAVPGIILACCLCLPAAAFAVDPAPQNDRQRLSATHEVSSSDIVEEVRFGREVAARIIGRYSMYDNEKLLKYVSLVGQSLVMNTSRPELDYHFAILNTEEINAYAAPGGYIFVTRGALQKMQNEAELAGVLAHEIGHVVERHIVRELNIRGGDNSATAGLAHAIGGSSDAAKVAFVQSIDKAVDILFKDGYKREDEAQADRDAVLFCALTGYEPAGLVRYFERINSIKGKQTAVLDKTHPSYESRINMLNSTISQEGLESKEFKINKKRFGENMKELK
jgi:beta-barrel assembly-enhancing protease